MSGGNKKKAPKTQGWEEAGSEFYQECFPTDAEVELPRDPKHLATLLPSKQNRVATTIRVRTNDNRTVRRQTSSRSRRESTVHRRTSIPGDVQVSMLPDLSENLSNEQTIWEEIMLIKTMPVPMSQKKEMKIKILNEPNLRLQGYEQFKWKRRKIWRQFSSRLSEAYGKLELWKGNLKVIEGNFGTGVVSYFSFIKWLLFLNIFVFIMNFFFIILPMVLLKEPDDNEKCFSNNTSFGEILLDVVQGTGFMRCTPLFYGYYPNETFIYNTDNHPMYYNIPMAYIGVNLLCFLVTLIAIVRSAAKGFKERLIEGEGQFHQYCSLIFGGWDFCIHNEKTANIKHKALYNEIKSLLESQKLEETKQNRTKNEKFKLILTRFIVNILAIIILIGCGFIIYFIFDLSTKYLNKFDICYDSHKNIEQLFYEFLPSITIVGLNIFVPFTFRYLITFENYTPQFVVRLTLFRTIFLRLSSLIVLCYSLYTKIIKHNDKTDCNELDCWENYVGKQIYKLVLTDFAIQIFLTFFINFPRALIARHINNKFIKFLGEQTFDLPKHVLDVIYSQTLCWLGWFFLPLITPIFSIIFFLLFYIKKFACLVNSKPSEVVYRVSRSKSMFMLILLISFIFALLPFVYTISELKPSKNCGPFRNLPSVWYNVVETFLNTPQWLQTIVFFLNTAGFALPVFVILIFLLYYYTAVNSANRHMVTVLKNQLILEGHDKQFLLERLSKFIKHQQENQKRLRRVEVLSSGDTQQISNM